jgi:hypothetical protein
MPFWKRQKVMTDENIPPGDLGPPLAKPRAIDKANSVLRLHGKIEDEKQIPANFWPKYLTAKTEINGETVGEYFQLAWVHSGRHGKGAMVRYDEHFDRRVLHVWELFGHTIKKNVLVTGYSGSALDDSLLNDTVNKIEDDQTTFTGFQVDGLDVE